MKEKIVKWKRTSSVSRMLQNVRVEAAPLVLILLHFCAIYDHISTSNFYKALQTHDIWVSDDTRSSICRMQVCDWLCGIWSRYEWEPWRRNTNIQKDIVCLLSHSSSSCTVVAALGDLPWVTDTRSVWNINWRHHPRGSATFSMEGTATRWSAVRLTRQWHFGIVNISTGCVRVM